MTTNQNVKKSILEKFPQAKIIEDFDIIERPCYSKGLTTWISSFAKLEEIGVEVPIYTVGCYDFEPFIEKILQDIQKCLDCDKNQNRIFLFLSNYDSIENRWGDTRYSCDIGVCTA